MHRTLQVIAAFCVLIPTFAAAQIRPLQGGTEEIPAPEQAQPTPPPITPPQVAPSQTPVPPPVVQDAPAQGAPVQGGAVQGAIQGAPSIQHAQKPVILHSPTVVQRSDSMQKIHYQKAKMPSPYVVTYHQHHRLRRPCCPMVKMIVAIPDPLRPGCVAEVCVTAPACVKGSPQVIPSRGFLGRGVVTMYWPNGHRVKVVFKTLHPHVMVHTYPA